jgi:hypothetical protein
VSAPSESPSQYRVSCSARVRDHLIKLSRKCQERGDGDKFIAALREFDYRLRVYPQFGDPLVDLEQEEGTSRIGVIRPLSMRYSVIETHRLVLLAALPVLMPMRGT